MSVNENQIGNEEDLFNVPLEVQSDEEDSTIDFDNDFFNQEASYDSGNNDDDNSGDSGEINFDDENDSQSAAAGDGGAGASEDNDLDFDDEKANAEEDDVFKAEDAIEKLKNLGYKIDKSDEVDEKSQKLETVSNLDKQISNIESFIKQDDMVLCRQRVIQDLTDEYVKNGRREELNGEDFKADVEAQMDEYNYNPRLASLEAKAIRTDMERFISEKKNEKSGIEKEIADEELATTKNHRIELQKSFKGYNNKTLFGQKLDAETIKTAYKKMVSGEVAKTINNDKNIQAEVALYLEFRETLLASKGSTYGEGVAATVKALNGDESATRTSLNKAVQRPGAGNSLVDRIASWGARTAVGTKK